MNTSSPESLLDRLFGHHCGLNADWSVAAWRVSGQLYAGTFICDEEDGTFSLVRSYLNADELHTSERIANAAACDVASLVVIARTNAECAAKGLDPLCGEQIALLCSDEPEDLQECASMLQDLRARCGLTIETSDLA